MMNRLSYAIGKVSCCHTKLISVECKVKEFGGWEGSARDNSFNHKERFKLFRVILLEPLAESFSAKVKKTANNENECLLQKRASPLKRHST